MEKSKEFEVSESGKLMGAAIKFEITDMSIQTIAMNNTLAIMKEFGYEFIYEDTPSPMEEWNAKNRNNH